jgi:cysteine desulfurase
MCSEVEESKLIIVGDSLGQVASQTIYNVSALYSSVDGTVAAPLLGSNKTEIITVARRIGTFDLSAVQAEDCCQYLMCKVGANLSLSPKVLRACVRRLPLSDPLRVRVDHYFNGNLLRTEETMLTPRPPPWALEAERPRRSLALRIALEPSVATPSLLPRGKPSTELEVVHFDAAAGTEVPWSVIEAVAAAPQGNPNSLHGAGRMARMAIEKTREELAAVLKVSSSDIIFTSGGTESNQIALAGFRVVCREAWMHASTCGYPDVLQQFSSSDERPPIAVIDLVNHETGSVTTQLIRPADGVRLHVDACQALFKIPWDSVDLSHVDSMSFTAHKINGPVGCGMLYIKDLKKSLARGAVRPLMHGGPQEMGLRPGTENVSAIVGLGAALKLQRPAIHREIEAFVVASLTVMGLVVNHRGPTSGFIVHATLPLGYDHVAVVSMMSALHRVEIGTGAACKTGQRNVGVYETLGISPIPEKRSIRLSWDSFTPMNHAERAMEALKATLRELKRR